MSTRIMDLGLSVFASVAALLLSWPYWRDFEYWAESRWAWLIYFVLGFVLAVYVLYVFLIALRTLFEHDELERAERIEAARRADGNGEGRP
ncbi:MAG: hypothetical protein GX826_05425 [Gammaproteobacteria bacterium]|nr:hypothetical protein [Gammaproteobacteria bacterium]